FRETFGRRNADVFHTLYDDELSPQEMQRQSDRKEGLFRERARGRLQPLAGARELVEALHDAGYPLALGTSAPRANATMMIEELGLSRFFEAQVTGDDVAAGKPDPEVFRTAAQRLHVPPERCLVIEDAAAGVEAAHRAGMVAVAVLDQPTEGHRRAEWVVGSLVELNVDTVAELIRRNVSSGP
ncbi:MAG: HAD family hydrolase, partial [Candidatus Bipolaricaulia bacterium]